MKSLCSFCIVLVFVISCNGTNNDGNYTPASQLIIQHKKDERNKAIVLKCIAAYAKKDSLYILAQNSDSIVTLASGKGLVRGNDSVRSNLRSAFSDLKDFKPTGQVVLAENNYVFAYQYVDVSLLKSGFVWHGKQVEIFKFDEDGKIIFHTGVNEDLAPNDQKVSF